MKYLAVVFLLFILNPTVACGPPADSQSDRPIFVRDLGDGELVFFVQRSRGLWPLSRMQVFYISEENNDLLIGMSVELSDLSYGIAGVDMSRYKAALLYLYPKDYDSVLVQAEYERPRSEDATGITMCNSFNSYRVGELIPQ